MNINRELEKLAAEREKAYEAAVQAMNLNPSEQLRQMRAYLARQEDYRRIKKLRDKIVQLRQQAGGACELECPSVEFVSGTSLEFTIRMEPQPPGWRIRSFQFHLRMPKRAVDMVRIHLNAQPGRDHMRVPRCHLHVGRGAKEGDAHIPFPVTSPLLLLHLLCEVIEPDFGG